MSMTWELVNPYLELVSGAVGDQSDSRIYTVDNNDANDNSEAIDNIDVKIGDGPTNSAEGRIRVYDGSAWLDSSAWSVGGTGTTTEITYLLLIEMLAGQKSAVRKYNGTITSNPQSLAADVMFYSRLALDGGQFLFMSGSFDAKLEQWTGEWVEVVRSTTSIAQKPPKSGDVNIDAPSQRGLSGVMPLPPGFQANPNITATVEHPAGVNTTVTGYTDFENNLIQTASAKDFYPADVIIGLFARITVTAHGFGSTDQVVRLKFTTTGTPPDHLTHDKYYNWKVIDANTLEQQDTEGPYSDTGTGTHTLTPSSAAVNSTAFGLNAAIDKSNQIALGDDNIDELKVGALRMTTTAPQDGQRLIASNGKMILQQVKTTLAVTTSDTYDAAAGELISRIVVISTAANTFKAGTTVGGSDIVPQINLIANTPAVLSIQNPYFQAATTIYFTVASATIIIYSA
jgi:hypothetical protein